jgi:hypothetical protein
VSGSSLNVALSGKDLSAFKRDCAPDRTINGPNAATEPGNVDLPSCSLTAESFPYADTAPPSRSEKGIRFNLEDRAGECNVFGNDLCGQIY